jgi:hypothetical protein
VGEHVRLVCSHLNGLQRSFGHRYRNPIRLASSQVVGIVDLARRLVQPRNHDVPARRNSSHQEIAVFVGIGEPVRVGLSISTYVVRF